MSRRNHHLLALIAALGVLLHAGMAAAQMFCAMTGTLATTCCCPMDEQAAGPTIGPVEDGCCEDALPRPTWDLQQHAPLPQPFPAAAWAQVLLPEPAAMPSRAEVIAAGASPPQVGLQTIVLLH